MSGSQTAPSGPYREPDKIRDLAAEISSLRDEVRKGIVRPFFATVVAITGLKAIRWSMAFVLALWGVVTAYHVYRRVNPPPTAFTPTCQVRDDSVYQIRRDSNGYPNESEFFEMGPGLDAQSRLRLTEEALKMCYEDNARTTQEP